MGKKFGSEPWIQELLERLNSNAEYEEAAKTWEGSFEFIIEPDGNLDHQERFYVDLWHGKARSGKHLKDGETIESAYKFSGKWSNFLKLMKGELDPLKGLVMGKFKLKGNMAAVMRAVKAAKQLVETLKMVETEFY